MEHRGYTIRKARSGVYEVYACGIFLFACINLTSALDRIDAEILDAMEERENRHTNDLLLWDDRT